MMDEDGEQVEKQSEVDVVKVKGDCDECGHSILYHVPIFGCLKCSCDEFR